MDNLFYQPELVNNGFFLDKEESKHCVKVLRKKAGDLIMATDGLGRFYTALITNAHIDRCEFLIKDVQEEKKRNYTIHLGISPTKSADRIEWMVEKCVEIGIDQVTLIQCRNTERKSFKTNRLEKIAISAMKQSKRAFKPAIQSGVTFRDFIKSIPDQVSKFIGHVDPLNPIQLVNAYQQNRNAVILIGPEGDFTSDELELANTHGFTKVSLGNYRLRTETAGMYACAIINSVNL